MKSSTGYKIESEHQFKNIVFDDYFKGKNISWEQEIDKIDFILTNSKSRNDLFSDDKEGALIHYFWAEAKKGIRDVYDMMTQLILTIKKTVEKSEYLMPPYLGCFDTEKIAFVRSDIVFPVFRINDFNWNIRPSNNESDDFKKAKNTVKKLIENDIKIFTFSDYQNEIKDFVKKNIITGKNTNKFEIDKNNFMIIFNKWLKEVKTSIAVNWSDVKNLELLEGDFYIADLLSINNISLKDKLSVLLVNNIYKMSAEKKQAGFELFAEIQFKDNQKAHNQFWEKYKRPPLDEYWEYITERWDRLVPQDIRERKGSFFTPPEWVELSQKYMADVFGKDWQDEYYIWDCAAGTGNLLAGLVDKYKIWASTLDKADVNVMKDRIKNGANMLEDHVFQFDFLNGDFKDLPEKLYNIISDEEERKKLVIYINPPYAEGDSRVGKGRRGVHKSKIHIEYKNDLGKASSELYAQFLIRIYKEISGCKIANFSTIKIFHSQNFEGFREIFKPKLNKLFIVPADTFDNVNGKFPIGFFIWDTEIKKKLTDINADVYDKESDFIGKKKIHSYTKLKYISQWLEDHSKHISENYIGHLASVGNDFQHERDVYIDDVNRKKIAGDRHTMISVENLIVVSIFLTVRKVIPANWLNNKDQFLFPNDGWKKDTEFQNNCFVYALFNNNIQSKYGVNNWIPYTEREVNASNNFKSNFMVNFINGKVKRINGDLFEEEIKRTGKMIFSDEAKAVINTGKKLWKLYHSFKNVKVNASLYDIKEFFQERNEEGRMNVKSNNDEYNALLSELKQNIKILSSKIVPQIFEYGFLLK